MIRRLTEAIASVEGEHMRPLTRVVVEEVKGGERGAATNPSATGRHGAGRGRGHGPP